MVHSWALSKLSLETGQLYWAPFPFRETPQKILEQALFAPTKSRMLFSTSSLPLDPNLQLLVVAPARAALCDQSFQQFYPACEKQVESIISPVQLIQHFHEDPGASWVSCKMLCCSPSRHLGVWTQNPRMTACKQEPTASWELVLVPKGQEPFCHG